MGRGGGDIFGHTVLNCGNISSALPSNFRTEMTNSVRSKMFFMCQAVQTFDLLFLNLSSIFLELENVQCDGSLFLSQMQVVVSECIT